MGKPKIDKVKLNRMFREGKTVKECAEEFSVTPGAITQAKKDLNINVVKTVAREDAHTVVGKNLDAVTQLQKINEKTQKIIDDLSSSSDRGDRAIILKACAEIRGQLNLQLEIFKTLYDMQAVQKFQSEVLSMIGEVDPEARDKIIDRLKSNKAIRGTLRIN